MEVNTTALSRANMKLRALPNEVLQDCQSGECSNSLVALDPDTWSWEVIEVSLLPLLSTGYPEQIPSEHDYHSVNAMILSPIDEIS